jgi:acetyltransferase-like isoleucine patch superfamily enzyme
MTGAGGPARREPLASGARKRLLQLLALYGPGAETLRVRLHRLRGTAVGEGVFIGTDVMIETSHPEMVAIGNRVDIGARTTIIAHQQGEDDRESLSVRIGDDVFIGPGCLILPHVTIGAGAVVSAGSVVTRSVPPLTMVRGNPAEPVARCGLPLGRSTPLREFYRRLEPIRRGRGRNGAPVSLVK